MCITDQVVIWLVSIFLTFNLLLISLFVLFTKLSESKLKIAIRNIIFQLDEIIGGMENNEKRSIAIQQISEFLGWQKLFIPKLVIGWIIDTEIATIRKIQKYTETHKNNVI